MIPVQMKLKVPSGFIEGCTQLNAFPEFQQLESIPQ